MLGVDAVYNSRLPRQRSEFQVNDSIFSNKFNKLYHFEINLKLIDLLLDDNVVIRGCHSNTEIEWQLKM